MSEVSLATSISMGNESRSEGLGRSVSNTEMGYQQELMLLIALQTVKNAHRKEKQHFAKQKRHQIATKDFILTF